MEWAALVCFTDKCHFLRIAVGEDANAAFAVNPESRVVDFASEEREEDNYMMIYTYDQHNEEFL